MDLDPDPRWLPGKRGFPFSVLNFSVCFGSTFCILASVFNLRFADLVCI